MDYQFNRHDRIADRRLLAPPAVAAAVPPRYMAVLPLGSVGRLNRHIANLNRLDAALKKIHAGMRVMAAGAGIL